MRRPFALVLLLACVLPARAQEIAVQPEWSDIETVTVRASPPGAVASDARPIRSLGAGPGLAGAQGLTWNSDVLADVMEGATKRFRRPAPTSIRRYRLVA